MGLVPPSNVCSYSIISTVQIERPHAKPKHLRPSLLLLCFAVYYPHGISLYTELAQYKFVFSGHHRHTWSLHVALQLTSAGNKFKAHHRRKGHVDTYSENLSNRTSVLSKAFLYQPLSGCTAESC